eukprot:gene13061-13164_t
MRAHGHAIQPQRILPQSAQFCRGVGVKIGRHMAGIKPIERPVDQIGQPRVIQIGGGHPRHPAKEFPPTRNAQEPRHHAAHRRV